MLDQSYADGAAFFPLDDSVNNRVFYQRLEKKRRYLQVFQRYGTRLLGGVLRGILPEGTQVHKGMKSGDVDPRGQVENCYTASDKALAVGGGVLEAILHLSGILRREA